jgi:hypothetical protein
MEVLQAMTTMNQAIFLQKDKDGALPLHLRATGQRRGSAYTLQQIHRRRELAKKSSVWPAKIPLSDVIACRIDC